MIKTNIELRPFTVPNYVIVKVLPKTKQDGFIEAPKYHLSELDGDTLEQLCDQFREDVFAKANEGNDLKGDV